MSTAYSTTPTSHAWRYTKKLKAFSPTERDALASSALVLLDLLNAGALVVSRQCGPSAASNTATLLLRLNLLEDSLYGQVDEPLVQSRLAEVVAIACSIRGEKIPAGDRP
jgi:hypothetical protein